MRTRALLLLPLVVYLTFPTRNYYWDGVGFAILVEKNYPAAALLYPSHLIYNLWGSWLYHLSAWMGLRVRSLYLMQAANCLFAGAAVMLFYRCFRIKGWSPEHALMVAWTFGFSATWWKFASDADAYTPAIFLLLCAYLLLENPRLIWLGGLAHAAAMLFHELAILFLPVAILLLWKRKSLILKYCVAALMPMAVAYAWAYHAAFANGAPQGFAGWVTLHSPDSGFSFEPLRDLVYTLRGTLRLIFGGRLLDLGRDPLSYAACALLVCALAGFVLYAWRAVPMRLTSPPATLLVWLGVYVAFLFVWMPQNTFYRLFYVAPLFLIVGMAFGDTPKLHRVGFSFAAVLALWNFVFMAYPESRTEFNAPLRFALAQHDAWPPGSAIVFHRFHPDLWTISYFNQQAAWMSLDRADLDEMERDLAYAQTQQKPLWVEETAFQLITGTTAGRQWMLRHERPGELVRYKDEKHEFVFHSIR